jgi:hypothetical protein
MFDEVDDNMILHYIYDLQPIITGALNQIVSKKSGFDRIGASPMILSNLKDLQSIASVRF